MTTEETKPTPTRAKLLIATATAFIAVYIFGSLAWDSGNYWHYSLTLLSIFLGVRYLVLGLKAKKDHE